MKCSVILKCQMKSVHPPLFRFESAFLGTADFQVEEVGEAQVRITGQIFQRRITLDCLLSTRAPYDAEISVTLPLSAFQQLTFYSCLGYYPLLFALS